MSSAKSEVEVRGDQVVASVLENNAVGVERSEFVIFEVCEEPYETWNDKVPNHNVQTRVDNGAYDVCVFQLNLCLINKLNPDDNFDYHKQDNRKRRCN